MICRIIITYGYYFVIPLAGVDDEFCKIGSVRYLMDDGMEVAVFKIVQVEESNYSMVGQRLCRYPYGPAKENDIILYSHVPNGISVRQRIAIKCVGRESAGTVYSHESAHIGTGKERTPVCVIACDNFMVIPVADNGLSGSMCL